MSKHIMPLLMGLASIALVAQTSLPPTPTPTTQQTANLKGCADLGITTVNAADSEGWRYFMPSPDGTYVVQGQHLGSHGCHNIVIYQCVNQQSSGDIGCDGIFPPESQDLVFAKKWVSDNDLQITRLNKPQTLHLPDYFKVDLSPAGKMDKVVGLSPDGQWQIFTSNRDKMAELYRQHLDGTHVQRLTHSLGVDRFLGWSPDGQWMIVDSPSVDYYQMLPVKMRPDGSQIQPLMSAADMDQSVNRSWTTLSFSPDSHWLLMQGLTKNAKTDVLESVIYRLSVPDGDLTRLTDPTLTSIFQAWLPDGQALIGHMTGHGSENAFEVVNIVTMQTIPLVTGNFLEFQHFTDDRKAVVFLTSDGKGHSIFLQVALGGSGSQVIEIPKKS